MTQHSVGDKLARGDASASFSVQAGLSNFTNDLIFNPEIVQEKYGLTAKQVEEYQSQRLTGKKLPDLPTVATLEEEKEDQEDAMKLGFTVSDKRMPLAATVEVAPQKYPNKKYTPLKPILDRVLVMRVNLDEDEEELSDGSVRNKKTGFIMPAKWRQHSNVGIVLDVGDFAVMGGIRIPMTDIVNPGDRVMFGDYNTELFEMDPVRAQALCDTLKVNYVEHEDGLRIVYVQDIRGIETPIETNHYEPVDSVEKDWNYPQEVD